MKSVDELDRMTLWDITANEGSLTMAVLSIVFAVLAVMYTIINGYYKIKFWHRR